MRALERNKRKAYYSLFLGKDELRDANGRLTGEYELRYSPLACYPINHSPATGQASRDLFGELPEYAKVFISNDISLPIDEQTRLWIDVVPVIANDGSTSTPHDYQVLRISRSLNVLAVALKKVTVDG